MINTVKQLSLAANKKAIASITVHEDKLFWIRESHKFSSTQIKAG